MNTITTTLLFIIKDNKILLPLKKRGQGKGFYNGVGGKQQADETILDTLVRETKEEIGVTPLNFEHVGRIQFDLYYKGEKAFEIMEIYIAHDYEGEVIESDEMQPCWFDLNKVPYKHMFPDDKLWLERVLAGDYVSGFIKLDKSFSAVENKLHFEKRK